MKKKTGFAKNLIAKVKTFAKNVDQAAMSRRESRYERDKFKLKELQLKSKIEKQQADIRKSRAVGVSQSPTEAISGFLGSAGPGPAQKSAMPPKNPFGGALGDYEKPKPKKQAGGKSIRIRIDN